MSNQEIFVKMALDSWHAQVNAVNSSLAKLSDEQLMLEISPGRNRGIYLLGHLTAIHDLMLPLLLLEPSMFPGLKFVFVDSPDGSVSELSSITELKEQWKIVNEKLLDHLNSLSTEEWFTRHASISAEDFLKEPHRNRLSVLLSRTNHLSYHRGQLALLIKKN